MKKYALIIISIMSISILNAQYVEDALRYTYPNTMLTARVGGLGIAYHGIADDIGALTFNPAGLSLIQKNEVSFGMGFSRMKSNADYLGLDKEFKSNSEYITHFAMASPIQNISSKATFAVGYFLENDFNNAIQYEGFNSKYTMVASETNYGPINPDDNWAYSLYLADQNAAKNGFVTPYNDSLKQNSFTQESGGLHNISGGAGFDINEMISVGISLTGKWGSYKYTREFNEYDELGIYQNTTIDGYSFNSLKTKENLTAKLSGLTAAMGVQARILDFMRFSARVKFPTWYQIDEKFSARYTANFRSYPSNGQSSYYYDTGELSNSYNLTTPFTYSAGFSAHVDGVTIAAGVEYSDASQIEFSDAIDQVLALNTKLIQEIIGSTTWGFAVEYEVPLFPLAVRASYSKTTSPYTLDIANAAKDILAVGMSVYPSKNVRIDALIRSVSVSELRTNYNADYDNLRYTKFVLENSPLDIGFGLTYRY